MSSGTAAGRVLTLRRQTQADLGARLRALNGAPLTYADVGATAAGRTPAGYRRHHGSAVLGRGAAAFAAAAEGLEAWAAHRGAGMRLVPPRPDLAEGTTVVQSLALGPVHVVAVARIVYVVRDAHRFGFAYGSLPVHPEEGERSFVVVRCDDGTVRFDVTAFSRARRGPLGRVAAPAVQLGAHYMTSRYLRGLKHFVDGQEDSGARAS